MEVGRFRLSLSSLCVVELDIQVEYMWSRRPNLGQVLFYALRYIPFLDLPLASWRAFNVALMVFPCVDSLLLVFSGHELIAINQGTSDY
jgi:hypothetical protein